MRNIPDDNLAYPVLITLGNNSTGSGFHLNSGDHVYLVTAKHVLLNSHDQILDASMTLKCPSRELNDPVICTIDVDLQKLMAGGRVLWHPDKDIAAIHVMDNHGAEASVVDGVNIRIVAPSGIVTVGMDSIAFLDGVLVSNDVILYGYPSSLGLRHSPQFDYDKPLLRKGIVASVNENQGTLILDCPAYYGNSGGPVVQIEEIGLGRRHFLVGVVSEFIPYTENWVNESNGLVHTEVSNSGYSVAVSMDYVYEMLGIAKP